MRDFYSILGVKRDAGADEIKAAWRTKAKSVHPDQNRDDPLANIQLEAADYRWLTHALRDIAEASGKGRIISTLEGGYGLGNIGAAVAAHLMALGDCSR